MDRPSERVNILAAFGANEREIEELLTYNLNPFEQSRAAELKFPLAAEPHIAVWQDYLAEAAEVGVYPVLQKRLVQLQFPVAESISQSPLYRQATLKGITSGLEDSASELVLNSPEQLQLLIHPTPAGPIPILITANRADFSLLVQALTMRNEPKPVPLSMGACLVKGLNNWDRVGRYQRTWEVQNPGLIGNPEAWSAEFQRLIPHKALYQDTLLLLSTGLYSNVPAAALGLPEEEWARLSLQIRLEHECTHYFTLRTFGLARNNALDEVIADYIGLVAATGRFRADWFCHFMGLEIYPAFREGGRLQNYLGQPPLSPGAFKVLQTLVKQAGDTLERFDALRLDNSLAERARFLRALSGQTLEELAAPQAVERLQQVLSSDRSIEEI